MLEKKIEAGRKVAAELFPAENSIDAAIIATARLIIATIENRKQARLTMSDVHMALVAAGEGVTTLIQSRGAIASVHDEVVELRDRLNLPTKGYGCETGCAPTARDRTGLSIVS